MQLLGNIGEYRRISRKIAKDRGDDITKNSGYTRDSLNRALLDKKGANMVSRTRERAIDPLLVPALLALATPSIC